MTVQVLKSPLQDLGLNAEEKRKERQLLMLEVSLSVKTVRRSVRRDTVYLLMILSSNYWLILLTCCLHAPDVDHPPVLYGVDVEVHKPAERILVHWVYVSQISDGKEQDGRVFGDGSVTFSGLCYFNLCLFCNLEKVFMTLLLVVP